MRFRRPSILQTVLVALLLTSCGPSGRIPGSSVSNPLCKPAPCLVSGDVKVAVTAVDRNVSGGVYLKPDAGDHYVTLKVTFTNMSVSKITISQTDFRLKDAVGMKHGVAFSPVAGCEMWQPVDLVTGASRAVEILPGGNAGPRDLCFQAFGAPEKPIALIWTSTLGESLVEIPS